MRKCPIGVATPRALVYAVFMTSGDARAGGRSRGPRGGNDERVDKLKDPRNDQGARANGNVEGVNEGVGGAPEFSTIIAQQLQNLLPAILAQECLANSNWVGCSYKEFLACNPKEYDGKGGAVVLTRWIEKMKFVQDMSGCSIDQKVKYTTGSFVGKALTWWNSQIRTLSRKVAVSMSRNDFKCMMIEEFCPSHEMQKLETELSPLVTPESRKIERYVYGLAPQIRKMVAATKPKTMPKAVQISGALTDEAVRNRSIKKVVKRGNVREHSKDKNDRDDNKRTRTGNAFATTTNPVGRENMGAWPKCTTCNSYHAPKWPCRTCFNCNRPGHFEKGRGNQENQARGRAFMLGAKEARQDPNIVTGTFTLNNHFATNLFDFGADYSFVSTTFIPLLGIKANELGFRYEIEIASGQLVEIDKVIKACKLEIEGHVFDIDLIPFGRGSFDVIIGMDWLSNHKAEIICHEKVVRIPLLDDKVLRVLGERPKEKARLLMSAKASDKKQEEILWLEIFLSVGIKSLLDAVEFIAAHVFVNTAQLELVLLVNFKENILSSYYCWWRLGDGGGDEIMMDIRWWCDVDGGRGGARLVEAEMVMAAAKAAVMRLQKLVSQLEVLGEKLSQEDINKKLLRNLSTEWNTHVVVWRNKADMDTMSMDDLYNNLKVYESEVKGMSSSSSSTQNMAFVSSLNNNTSSTNRVVNTAQPVNTAHGFWQSTNEFTGSKVIDSGCLRHMIGNMSYLTDYEEIYEGYVAFEGNHKGGKITGKCTIKTEAVNTACYVQNRVLVVKPHNKTPYKLFHGRTPTLSFMRPFGCLVTILNTIDHLDKFNGNVDEGSRPDWLFDIDALTKTINYEPIVVGTQSNGFAATKASDNACQARKETEPVKDHILLPLWTADPPFSQDPKSSHDDGSKPSSDDGKKVDEDPRIESECKDQKKEDNVNSTNNVNTAGTNEVNVVGGKTGIELPFDLNMHALEDASIFDFLNNYEDDGPITDMNNLDTTIQVSPTPTTRIHKDHPLNKVIGDLHSTTQTRQMSKNLEEHGFALDGFSGIKKDEMGNVIRNKARLVAQKDTQEEEIDYYEVFAPIARIEAIRLFLAYASFKDFVVYQMDVKSAFLYEKIEEEVFTKVKTISTTMETQKPLLKDEDWEEVDVHMYRSMVGSLMYLTSLRPDIMFVVCACARYQVNPKFWSTAKAKTINGEAQIHAIVDGKKIIVTESSVRRDLQLADEEYEAVHKELGDKLVRAATIASSLEAEQDNGAGPRCQKAIRDTIAQTRFENVSKQSNDLLVARGNTLQSDEDRMKLNELMELCTDLQTRVLDLEKRKITQDNEIASLKRRVKKLKKRNRSRTHKLKRLYKVVLTARVESYDNKERLGEDASKQRRRIDAIDTNKDITLNMKGYKLKDLKLKEFDNIQKMFDKAFKRVNTFVDFRTEVVEGKEKRAREELIQKSIKKQKVEDDKETTELKQLMEIILDKEEVAIDAIPLAVKSLGIVDWKINKERKKSYYQIIRADGKSQMYMFFSQMLIRFDMEDLKDLYKLLKARYGSTRPVEDLDFFIMG
nr:hypothetical protein [Tanacetum cinerariifolium]